MDSWKVCLASWKVQSWTFQLARQLVRTKRLITASGFEQKVVQTHFAQIKKQHKRHTHTNNKQFGYSYGALRNKTGRWFLTGYLQWCLVRGLLAVHSWRSSRRGTNDTGQLIKILNKHSNGTRRKPVPIQVELCRKCGSRVSKFNLRTSLWEQF